MYHYFHIKNIAHDDDGRQIVMTNDFHHIYENACFRKHCKQNFRLVQSK